jgi:hypothetical protein
MYFVSNSSKVPPVEIASEIIGVPFERSNHDPTLVTFTSTQKDLTSQRLLDQLATAGVPSVVGGMKRVGGEFRFFLTVRVS